ncbi:MAG: hypothetical protein E7268_01260 [Lachnospiraceae bacterium]|nr:hypothetical protein [Lachnospiraceae bacterium]
MKSTRISRSVQSFLFYALFGVLSLAGCSSDLSGQHTTPPASHSDITSVSDRTPTPFPTSDVIPLPDTTPKTTEAPTATPTSTPTPKPTPTGTPGEVCFSEATHFFTENTFIELSIHAKKDGYITYTLDGTEPTESSTLYTEPILLITTDADAPNVYPFRAKVWYDDGTCSDSYVHTYFLSEKVNERYTTLVFSINGNPAELTDGPKGILYGENYKQRGRASERQVHIEALSSDGTLLFDQHAGVRVFGGSSREHAVKSLKLYARKEYETGKGSFRTDVFGSTDINNDPITKYDKLVLRNGGDDFQSAFLRDELVQRLGADAGFSVYEAVVPALAYVNGEYYGFYWLHESYCDKYFQNRNEKSDGEYIVLEGSDRYKSVSGDTAEVAAAKEFNALYSKYANADLKNDTTYEELCSLIDVESYLDYMSLNMYVANYDWPQGNYRCYRYYAANGEEYGTGDMDGRWRFLLHDADVGFGTYQSSDDAGAARNDLKQVLSDPSSSRYAPLLAALLKREDCRNYFIDKMLAYMNGAFSYENVCRVLEEMCAERDAELVYYYNHLNTLKDSFEIYARPARTELHLARIRSFAEQRPVYMTKYLEDFFGVDLNAGNE